MALKSQHSVLFKKTSHSLHPSFQGIQSFWLTRLFLPELKDLVDHISPSKCLWLSLCVLGTGKDRYVVLVVPPHLCPVRSQGC